MGGFFSSAPPAPAVPALPQPEDTEAKDRENRLKALERRRRGRTGLIRTSERGLLQKAAPGAPQSKRLLGD